MPDHIDVVERFASRYDLGYRLRCDVESATDAIDEYEQRHGATMPTSAPTLRSPRSQVRESNGPPWTSITKLTPGSLNLLTSRGCSSRYRKLLRGRRQRQFSPRRAQEALPRVAGFTDAALQAVARLTGLTYLQTFGNLSSDQGVQTASHTQGTWITSTLEEETLRLAAFVDQLPRLARLGLQDVVLSDGDLDKLRHRLPGVRVG